MISGRHGLREEGGREGGGRGYSCPHEEREREIMKKEKKKRELVSTVQFPHLCYIHDEHRPFNL